MADKLTWQDLKDTVEDGHIDWRKLLDDRQHLEVDWALLYDRDFHHGTTGHNQLLVIAKLAHMLDAVQENMPVFKGLDKP